MFVTHSFQIPYEKHLYDDLRIMQRRLLLFGMILFGKRIRIISPLKNGLAKLRFNPSKANV